MGQPQSFSSFVFYKNPFVCKQLVIVKSVMLYFAPLTLKEHMHLLCGQQSTPESGVWDSMNLCGQTLLIITDVSKYLSGALFTC
mmetsp:Transcript_72130/g.121023  ORF Transcript_72130/g.121023 Transcript_72130/m.121023 type:complete len:84 (-) Transcript_72130:377-628(-)